MFRIQAVNQYNIFIKGKSAGASISCLVPPLLERDSRQTDVEGLSALYFTTKGTKTDPYLSVLFKLLGNGKSFVD